MNNGRLVIVLQNSPYTGAYTKLVNSDSYDGSAEDLQGSDGLEIHGNDQSNFLIGSAKSDLIYGYGAADLLNGGAGKDELHFGLPPTLEKVQSNDGEVDKIYSTGTIIGNGGAHLSPFVGQAAASDFNDSYVFAP